MHRLSEHINAFVRLMKQKGYIGHFLCNTSHPGRIEESLQKHLLECLQGSTYIPPFYLTTYSHWINDESPYVKCDFKVRYNDNDGFNVMKLDMDYRNHCGSIRKKDIPINTNLTIPDRDQVNRMMTEKKKGMKI